MTRDEIIRMAREAGGTAVDHAIVLTYEEAQRFVDAARGDYIEGWEEGFKAGAAAERERCAKVCEETTIAWTEQAYKNGCTDCAAAIRRMK